MAGKDPDLDKPTGVMTTGHEWDGIRELNNPLPRWWLWTFYACILWALLYAIAYPAWPMISQATQGLLGHDQRVEVAEELAAADRDRDVYRTRIAAMDLTEISADPELSRFAMGSGAATFRTYCAQCHGAGAAGHPGYPNLLDDDWLWGGDLDAIRTTVTHGIRSPEDDDTRMGDMLAFGRDGLLEKPEIAAVVEFVLAQSGQEHDPALAETGATVFADNCASCHGEDGTGTRELGAPDLTDAIWLYGGDRATITATVTNGRSGMMPNWNARLSEEQIKEVAIYVHALGGGE
ncbi:cytochrome-c oxidase, cbb3-type subunit III [Paroceanicella profunda]|uniref:Cbb3-type cytochrome c oxidase subunit n=1 Tax=Paroceanicella profunda TaxID=2579971 RepID=A0A5B8FHP8_9RHOB|nr:cytochrome-c oxidase, cbb3-type subunit III [Paroceanicella profunda]QDL92701.1 cytochrome-c oxidase, cbb3-type subunit III [Paroceanicella profunda]